MEYTRRPTANLDRDRHVGGSRPNQNDYVFYNTCNAPSYIETTDRRDFGANRQSGGDDQTTGAIVKNSWIL